MRGRGEKSVGIAAVSDNQSIDDNLNPGAVVANDAHQGNLVLNAVFNERRQLRRIPDWGVRLGRATGACRIILGGYRMIETLIVPYSTS
jgi:hypothetical protein